MRLITLGDSASAGIHNWPTPLSQKLDCELINFAKPASQNLLQIQLMQDWLIDNNLHKDDIVIWEIGWSSHPVLHIGYEHWNKVQRAERIIQNKLFISHYHIRNNKIDKKNRISLLPISPIIHKFVDRKKPNDDAEVLHNLLFMFVIIKKLCSRLLVIRAKDIFVPDNLWKEFKKLLFEKNIDFLNVSIYEWCRDKNLGFFSDNEHPDERSMQVVAQELIYPKLKSLNWI